MLKKSLIPAALVALSSTSAFADAESFHMGLKGLYFSPKASEAAGAVNKNSATKRTDKVASEGGILLVGPQFGYYISDSIRVGVAGYMGFGEFKSTFTIKTKNNQGGGQGGENKGGNMALASSSSAQMPLTLRIEAPGLIPDSKPADAFFGRFDYDGRGATKYSKTCDIAIKEYLDQEGKVYDGEQDFNKLCQDQEDKIEQAKASIKDNPSDSSNKIAKEGEIRALERKINAARLSLGLERAKLNSLKRSYQLALDGPEGASTKSSSAVAKEEGEGLPDSHPKGRDAGKWIETLAPKGVILATVDAKLFENDVFSLGAGVGMGATNWKATWKLESTQTGKKESAYTDLPNKKEASKWALAGMGTVNASVTLGDVATLTGHVGYAHLGKPEGLTYGDAKGSSSKTISTDETRSQGWVFGVGIGKDF